MKMLLHPSYVSLESAEPFSPNLFRFLQERGVELEDTRWDGMLESLPTDERVIVRSSGRMLCSEDALVRRCDELGHLVFYDDESVHIGGNLLREATEFLGSLTG